MNKILSMILIALVVLGTVVAQDTTENDDLGQTPGLDNVDINTTAENNTEGNETTEPYMNGSESNQTFDNDTEEPHKNDTFEPENNTYTGYNDTLPDNSTDNETVNETSEDEGSIGPLVMVVLAVIAIAIYFVWRKILKNKKEVVEQPEKHTEEDENLKVPETPKSDEETVE